MNAVRLAIVVVLTVTATAQKREDLVEQLASTDAGIRSRAYSALQADRDPEVVALVGKRIAELPDPGLRFALWILQGRPIDDTRAVWTKLLGAERAWLRAAAAAALLRAGERVRSGVLAKAIAAAPIGDRQDVLNALWSIEDTAVADAVRGYLVADAPLPLVVSTLDHLQQLEKGRSAATEVAVRALLAADGKGRIAALTWLLHGADAKVHAKELATALAAGPALFWQIETLLAPGRKYPEELTEAFVQALGSSRSPYDINRLLPIVRAQAPDRVVPTLRQLLTHTNAQLRAAAVQALAGLPGGLEAKDLQAMLRADDPEQQLAAATVLRRMDDPSGLPVVLALAQKSGTHRVPAVQALAGFRSREVVDTLLAALDAAELPVRTAAWSGLQQVWRGLFPYRRFEFERSGYQPNGADRAAAIAVLRSFWNGVR
ncbi:MAG: hypothetical protein IPK26_03415 [Planctomycetes bacterium]|nr:hypothetical protein [Planctomycetota bacterium]